MAQLILFQYPINFKKNKLKNNKLWKKLNTTPFSVINLIE
jgi:hypothetical protein